MGVQYVKGDDVPGIELADFQKCLDNGAIEQGPKIYWLRRSGVKRVQIPLENTRRRVRGATAGYPGAWGAFAKRSGSAGHHRGVVYHLTPLGGTSPLLAGRAFCPDDRRAECAFAERFPVAYLTIEVPGELEAKDLQIREILARAWPDFTEYDRFLEQLTICILPSERVNSKVDVRAVVFASQAGRGTVTVQRVPILLTKVGPKDPGDQGWTAIAVDTTYDSMLNPESEDDSHDIVPPAPESRSHPAVGATHGCLPKSTLVQVQRWLNRPRSQMISAHLHLGACAFICPFPNAVAGRTPVGATFLGSLNDCIESVKRATNWTHERLDGSHILDPLSVVARVSASRMVERRSSRSSAAVACLTVDEHGIYDTVGKLTSDPTSGWVWELVRRNRCLYADIHDRLTTCADNTLAKLFFCSAGQDGWPDWYVAARQCVLSWLEELWSQDRDSQGPEPRLSFRDVYRTSGGGATLEELFLRRRTTTVTYEGRRLGVAMDFRGELTPTDKTVKDTAIQVALRRAARVSLGKVITRPDPIGIDDAWIWVSSFAEQSLACGFRSIASEVYQPVTDQDVLDICTRDERADVRIRRPAIELRTLDDDAVVGSFDAARHNRHRQDEMPKLLDYLWREDLSLQHWQQLVEGDDQLCQRLEALGLPHVNVVLQPGESREFRFDWDHANGTLSRPWVDDCWCCGWRVRLPSDGCGSRQLQIHFPHPHWPMVRCEDTDGASPLIELLSPET